MRSNAPSLWVVAWWLATHLSRRRLAGPLLTLLVSLACLQVATAVTRAVPRTAAPQRATVQLQSVARISSAAQLCRQQGSGVAATARLSVVRAMATASGPVTKKVRGCMMTGKQREAAVRAVGRGGMARGQGLCLQLSTGRASHATCSHPPPPLCSAPGLL